MGLVEERAERTRWFREARFGMFIHWGLYAITSRGEWVRSIERIGNEAYQRTFEEFDPSDFDPKRWARAAREAGMKYAVMTAKHHDGFCLFDSTLTDYTSLHTRARRDLVREYLEAFRAEGLKVGVYYSVIDWHHPDYPAFGDKMHPERDNPAFRGKSHDFARYLDYLHGQVRELCTGYGTLDIMWFDFSYDALTGEAWRATDLVTMVRSFQPEVVIDNRLDASGDGDGSITSAHPTAYAGDFASPEQYIPAGGVRDANGAPVPWEACITMNEHWGYCATDHAWKPSRLIVRKLVECVAKDGNLLLNVGPDARGRIPEPSLAILAEIGAWIGRNGASIFGCGSAPLPKPDWGWYTARGTHLYAHVLEQGIGPVRILPGAADRVRSVHLLADGSECRSVHGWPVHKYPDDLFVSFGDVPHATYPLPDPVATVVDLELARAPEGRHHP